MTLRDTDPRRLENLIKDAQQEWENTTGEERVQQTWNTFIQAYQLIGAVAWEIEASRGNLGGPNRVSQTQPADTVAVSVRDYIAGGALNASASRPPSLKRWLVTCERTAAKGKILGSGGGSDGEEIPCGAG